MGPGHGEQNELHREQLRARDPVEEQDTGIMGWRAVEQHSQQAYGCKMQRDQKRNAEPQCELRDLGEGVAKMPALIERPQAEAERA